MCPVFIWIAEICMVWSLSADKGEALGNQRFTGGLRIGCRQAESFWSVPSYSRQGLS